MSLTDEVCSWLQEQPTWQQDLARRLTVDVDLGEAQLQEALNRVKADLGLQVSGTPLESCGITREDLSTRDMGGAVAKLLRFGQLRGVGLVVPDGELTFASEGLTLIFGQNGAGKTSYVRGLKALCRTVDQDCRILGNVYAQTAEPPSAMVGLDISGVPSYERTPLTGPKIAPVPGVTVFDSACAELYVDAKNTVQYIPAELLLLTRLAVAQDRMRKLIDTERIDLRAQAPSLAEFGADTKVAAVLRELRGTHDDPDLAALARLSEADMAQMASLQATIAAAEASTARADALAARNDAREATDLATALGNLAGRANAAAAQGLRDLAAADRVAREALTRANEEFSATPVTGIGTEPWRLLWDAAREFVSSDRGAFPPGPGDPCPLCLQAVGAEAAERMAHFEEHVKGSVQAKADEAARRLAAAVADSGFAQAGTCRTAFLAGLAIREPELGRQVQQVVDDLETHLRTMVADPAAATAAPDLHSDAVTGLTAWATKRNKHADTLLASDDPTQLAAMRRELAEFRSRQLLGQRLGEFEESQARLRHLSALDRVHSALATNRITTKQRELSTTQVAETLRKALIGECGLLRCNHLPVNLNMQTARAQTTMELVLSRQREKLSEVMSEGEQRAVALAFFFAELNVAADDGGIVLDDPVSSLDDVRSGYIVDRLISEAQHRQVIVFTHDLPFLTDLQARAKEADMPVLVQGMWRDGDRVGLVDPEPPFKVMRLRERLGKLKDRVAQWNSLPPPSSADEAWGRVKSFYNDLRTTWERAVEERIFAEVVQRFQRAVKTQSLKDVRLTPELVRLVDRGMSRASMFVHDEPVGGSVPLPGKAELEADLDLLVQFEKEARK